MAVLVTKLLLTPVSVTQGAVGEVDLAKQLRRLRSERQPAQGDGFVQVSSLSIVGKGHGDVFARVCWKRMAASCCNDYTSACRA